MSRIQPIGGLILWLLVSFLPALAGVFFSPGAWYEALEKPAFTPPGWVFGPVWTLLYALMGVAAWRVWRQAGLKGAPVALGLFVLQLVLNGAWTAIFFGAQRTGAAFAELVLLWAAIVATIVAFWRRDKPAAALLLPYLAWVSYAAVLNYWLWRLNN